jgi:hypothetical protein
MEHETVTTEFPWSVGLYGYWNHYRVKYCHSHFESILPIAHITALVNQIQFLDSWTRSRSRCLGNRGLIHFLEGWTHRFRRPHPRYCAHGMLETTTLIQVRDQRPFVQNVGSHLTKPANNPTSSSATPAGRPLFPCLGAIMEGFAHKGVFSIFRQSTVHGLKLWTLRSGFLKCLIIPPGLVPGIAFPWLPRVRHM